MPNSENRDSVQSPGSPGACASVRGRLRDFAMGELTDAERSAARAHVETCPVCLAALSELDPLAGFLAGTSAPPVPEAFAARIVEAARSRRIPARTARGLVHWWRPASAAVQAASVAALVAGATLGGLLGWTVRQPIPRDVANEHASRLTLGALGIGSTPGDTPGGCEVGYVTGTSASSLVRSYLQLVGTIHPEER